MMDITLALGGGGAKGIAHVGVIRRLEDEGFRIRAIAGTSAGGLIGAVYAAGYSTEDIEEILSQLDQNHMFRRTNQDGPSLLGLAGITQLLVEVLGDRTFDSLRIPFSCTSVDTLTSQEVILSQGRVVDAVLATIAVPGIFPPRHYRDSVLVDGGVLDPVPVALARRSFPKLPVFAVVLSPPPEKWRDLPSASLPSQNPLVDQFSKLRLAQAFNIFMQSVDISGRMLAELRLQIDQPDLVIRPDVAKIGLLDKVNVHEMVVHGQTAVDYILPEIHQRFNWKRRTIDKFRNIFNKP